MLLKMALMCNCNSTSLLTSNRVIMLKKEVVKGLIQQLIQPNLTEHARVNMYCNRGEMHLPWRKDKYLLLSSKTARLCKALGWEVTVRSQHTRAFTAAGLSVYVHRTRWVQRLGHQGIIFHISVTKTHPHRPVSGWHTQLIILMRMQVQAECSISVQYALPVV